MFRSYNSEQSAHLKPQEDLQNISFFEIGKSYHMTPNNKVKYCPNVQFSSWSEKDQQQFFNFSHYTQSHQINHKKSACTIFKRNPCQRLRFSNSMTFHTNKIDLGAKASQSINKYRPKSKSNTFDCRKMNLPLFTKKEIQNKNAIKDESKRKFELIKNEKFVPKQQNPQHQKQLLQTQPSYSIINYPISSALIRKRKFKQMQKFPFPSLAMRLNK